MNQALLQNEVLIQMKLPEMYLNDEYASSVFEHHVLGYSVETMLHLEKV